MKKPGIKIGLGGTIALVFSGMVGAGILVLPSKMAAFGSVSFLGWILGFIMTYCIFKSFMNVRNVYLSKKNTYDNPSILDFLLMNFCQNTSFSIALGHFIALTATAAVIGEALGIYIVKLLPIEALDIKYVNIIGIAVILILFILNLINSKIGDYLNQGLSFLKFIFFVALALVGLTYYKNYKIILNHAEISKNLIDLTKSAALAMFAFMGIEFAVFSAGSIENPDENIPKGTLLGLLAATLVFIGVYAGTVFVVDNVVECNSSVLQAAKIIFGDIASVLIGIVAVLSCITTLIGVLTVQGNSFKNFTKKNWLPSYMSKETKDGFPWVGALVSLILSISWIIITPKLLKYGIAIADISVVFVAVVYLSICLIDLISNGISIINISSILSSLIMFSNINLHLIIIMIIIYSLGLVIKFLLEEERI